MALRLPLQPHAPITKSTPTLLARCTSSPRPPLLRLAQVVIVHKSTQAYAAVNHEAPTATRTALAARLLLCCAAAQTALQLLAAGLLAGWHAAELAALTVLPLLAWLLLLAGGCLLGARLHAHLALFGALGDAGAVPGRAVYRWWVLGVPEMPPLLCWQMLGGVLLPLAPYVPGAREGAAPPALWAEHPYLVGAALLSYAVLSVALRTLARRHVLYDAASATEAPAAAYGAMLQSVGAALTAAAAAAAKQPSFNQEGAPPAAAAATRNAGGATGGGAPAPPASSLAGLVPTPAKLSGRDDLGGTELTDLTDGSLLVGSANEWFVLQYAAEGAAPSDAVAAREGPYELEALQTLLAEGRLMGEGGDPAKVRRVCPAPVGVHPPLPARPLSCRLPARRQGARVAARARLVGAGRPAGRARRGVCRVHRRGGAATPVGVADGGAADAGRGHGGAVARLLAEHIAAQEVGGRAAFDARRRAARPPPVGRRAAAAGGAVT